MTVLMLSPVTPRQMIDFIAWTPILISMLARFVYLSMMTFLWVLFESVERKVIDS